ncbi:MAG: phosphoribosylglycinamide formyltransferase [Bacteriovoracia bacterium]
MSNLPCRIVIFASGRGSNFQAICKAVKNGSLHASIEGLVCNVDQAPVIDLAKEYKVPVFVVQSKGKTRKQHEAEVLEVLSKIEFSWIVLAGYMRVFSNDFLMRFWDHSKNAARIVNIHPSLLPLFPGMDAYAQAIEAKVNKTGVTVHLVGRGVDDGPILSQREIPILSADDALSLEKKGLPVEHSLYVETLQTLFHPENYKYEVVSTDPRFHRLEQDLPIFFPKWAGYTPKIYKTDLFWVEASHSEVKAIDRAMRSEIFGDLSAKVDDFLPEKSNPSHQWWLIEKQFRFGVTDNTASALTEALHLITGKQVTSHSGKRLWIRLPLEVKKEEVKEFAEKVFANTLIEKVDVRLEKRQDQTSFQWPLLGAIPKVEEILLNDLDRLVKFSEEKLWALSRDELSAIREHYLSQGKATATDVEMEVFAQTWSEHCKHKIFAANIEVENSRSDVELPTEVKSLFKTFIAKTAIDSKKDYLKSVFEDNAGIVNMTKNFDCAIKVETHNSPSALDPYGGALTGIVGVNRDILGAGLGARPIANLDVFCVGPIDLPLNEDLPPKLHHPKRILEGIRLGVEHGGNKSGIPTVTGAVHFHEGYLGKPLVFCGTIGILPSDQNLHHKSIEHGDKIVMVGGRIGKDGIHGATFSSLELNETSPVSAVQLGDPLTQKRVADFLFEAQAKKLYRAVTDNGAGGLSSSVGELARMCGKKGGAVLDVGYAATKYVGLKPYELVISESQERMTFAVAPEHLESFLNLAKSRNVECSVVGDFVDSGVFEIRYAGQKVADLNMSFLHEGVPKLNLKARVAVPKDYKKSTKPLSKQSILETISSPNHCSRKKIVQQYDHEVQARSVKKPYGSPHQLAPGDGATLVLERETFEGIALGLGLAPDVAEYDPKTAAELAVDEALRNAVCAGMNPDHAVFVDNFCWPDPLESNSNPDAREKLGALVVTCERLYAISKTMGIPFVSGKDSMKNDYRIGGRKISVPPTVLITAMGKVEDVRKLPLGFIPSGELSLYWMTAQDLNARAYNLPKADWDRSKLFYQKVHEATSRGLVAAIHDVDDAGFLITTMEMLLGTGCGAKLDDKTLIDPQDLYFSGFVVAVHPKDCVEFEQHFETFVVNQVGSTNKTDEIQFGSFCWKVKELEDAYSGNRALW